MNGPLLPNWRVTRDLRPKLISHFLAVAACKSISRAAEALHLTQPALSKSIKQLEERLGVPLFERWPTGVRLTPFGEVLARRGQHIDREISYALTELQDLQGGATGAIRIGAGLIWSALFLPRVIARYQAEHPGIQIQLHSGVIDTLVPALKNGDLDIVCTTLDFPDHGEIAKEHLIEVCHGVFASKHHPLACRDVVDVHDLAAYGWIALKNDYVGNNRLAAFFGGSGLGPTNVRVETNADMSILALLGASNHLGSLPVLLSDTARGLGVVQLPVKGARMWVSGAGVAYRQTGYPTPAINAFLDMLRESFAEKFVA
jgi:DNA-binding transcriptional LysR family regulator